MSDIEVTPLGPPKCKYPSCTQTVHEEGEYCSFNCGQLHDLSNRILGFEKSIQGVWDMLQNKGLL